VRDPRIADWNLPGSSTVGPSAGHRKDQAMEMAIALADVIGPRWRFRDACFWPNGFLVVTLVTTGDQF